MIRSIGKVTLATILTAIVLGLPLAASAQDKAPAAPTAPPAPAMPATKPKATYFSGKLEAVDTAAQTITVGSEVKRVVQITPDTKFSKNGKPGAHLEDGVVGEPVSVSYTKTGDGADAKYTARRVSFGATKKKDAPAPAPAPAPPQ